MGKGSIERFVWSRVLLTVVQLQSISHSGEAPVKVTQY